MPNYNLRNYSLEEDEWLIENRSNYTLKSLTQEFNSKFERNVSVSALSSHVINTLGVKQFKKLNRHTYTPEEDEWLKQYVSPKLSYPEMTRKFNKRFHTDVTQDNLTYHCSKVLNISKTTNHVFTDEEDNWIRKHIDDDTYTELTKQFNQTFGTSLKRDSFISHAIKTLKLNKTINRGSVKKGERRCTNTLPVGSESTDGNYVYVKIANDVNDCKNRRMPSKGEDPNWKRKDYIVWESAGNELPKDSDQMLIHLNTDRMDCRIENLYLTSRKINFMMAKNGWYSTNPDLTLTGIKWCELFYARKEKL